MRTKTLLLSAAALAAGLASSMAQSNVYSVNIVGYVNTTLPSGAFVATANPLDDGTNTLDSLLGDLPVNSTVQFWNGSGFDVATRVPDFLGRWSGLPGTTPLAPGQGIFVNSASTTTNTWIGEVLTGELTNPIPSGFSFVANQVPVAGGADAIGLGGVLAVNDTVQKWNGSGFDVYTKVPPFLGGWSPSEPIINVAEGVFVGAAAAVNWTQEFNPNE